MSEGTRKEIKQKIKSGLVTVNGQTASDPGMHVDRADLVLLGGRPVVYEEFVYFMMNKPQGVLTATMDKKQQTVLDLIDEKTRKDLFPVGRLDKDTEGLLLICNDGQLAHALLAPARHVQKVYRADVKGIVTQKDVESFARGLEIDDQWTARPARLTILKTDQTAGTSQIEISIVEGRFHQIKRMFQAVGKEVISLKRISMGPLVLDGRLEPGSFRRLTDEEIKELKKLQNG